MDDVIYRQDAIDKFEPWLKVKGYNDGELNMLKVVLDELKCLPSADQNRWIPCSERLPEKEDWYIVTMKGYITSTAPMYFANGEWCDGHMCAFGKQNQIVAWMKKPKAYREEIEE